MATKTLYVGNLPYTVSESQLATHFQQYGSSKVRIVEGRGFGFVDIDASNLEAAIADQNQSQLDGRTLTVNEARPRTEGGSNSYSGGNSQRGGGRW
jgi:RNA recognition motif-containing protein